MNSKALEKICRNCGSVNNGNRRKCFSCKGNRFDPRDNATVEAERARRNDRLASIAVKYGI